MIEDKKRQILPHSIIVENRNKIAITGVLEVGSFDENIVIIYTDFGELHLKGSNFHISKLSLDIGEVNIDGQITSMIYTENQQSSNGLFSKLFR